jgi:hypothetical protein
MREKGESILATRILVCVLITILAAFGACAQASTFELTDFLGPNSSVNVNPDTQAGVYQWLVDGQNQMTQNSYWYRIGSTGPASPISSISSITTIPGMDFETEVLYSASAFDFDITYSLMGADPGSGTSDLSQTMVITNKTASPLALHLFEYVNMDLNGTALGDSATMDTTSALVQTGETKQGLLTVNPIPNAWELGAPSTLLSKLNSSSPFALANNASYSGDVACIFQWDMSIAANGGSLSMSQDNGILPEPTSAVALVSMLGLLPLIRRKRR